MFDLNFLPKKSVHLLATLCWTILLVAICSRSQATDISFTLEDRLGRSWTNERVRFPVPDDLPARATEEAALIDQDGESTVFEFVSAGEETAIEFLADLPKFGRATYRLVQGGQRPARSDLTVTEGLGEIRLENGNGGIAIRTRLTGAEAPIAAVKMPSGAWGGTSYFTTADDPVTDYHTTIERRGRVAAIVVAETHFASGLRWRLRVTLQATDPAILIDESWSRWDHPTVQIDFGPDLPGSRIYYRKGAGHNLGRIASDPALPEKGKQLFELEPWLRWWLGERRGNWLAAYDADGADALAVAALTGDRWISKDEYSEGRRIEPINIFAENGRLRLELPGAGARRSWLMAGLPRSETIDLSLVGKHVAPPPQQLVIRHGDFPLDKVKDLTLDWEKSDAPRKRLLLTESDRLRLSWSPQDDPKTRKRLGNLPVRFDTLHEFFDYYLRSGDEKIGMRISQQAVETMQRAVDQFLKQYPLVTMGFAPHHQRDIMIATHLADFALADRLLPAAQLDRLAAQAAFLSYVVHRPDYWSPRRGFGANPNMTSIVAGYQGMLACLLYDHPQAAQWLNASLAELFDQQLLTWSDKNGGWLEAPSYAMLSYDHMLGVFACARNQGRPDYLFHPQMKKVIRWFAKISTPPDPRISGRRHHPPIGNTYMLEPTGQFGTVAFLWRDQDPSFSAEMQWMHRASGEPVMSNVGGYAPALGPYQTVFKDPALPMRRPDYGSELFPKTGAILRAHFGSRRETQLHVIAGTNHDHYDYDSGSITIWGKGRLIADDFGYYGRAPRGDHSMVDAKSVSGTMAVETFTTQDRLDVFGGRSGAWTRQIAMLKDADPLGPNAYVIRDRLAGNQDGTWRLWLNAERIEVASDRVLVVGPDDIDTDIIFLSGEPSGLRIETRSRTSASSFFNKPYETTQQGLIVPMPADETEIAVLIYPRLKSDPSPDIRTAMDGRVITIETGAGSQTLLMGQSPFSYEDGTIAFKGTVGLIKHHNDAVKATLGAKGWISGYGHTLASEEAISRRWPVPSVTGSP